MKPIKTVTAYITIVLLAIFLVLIALNIRAEAHVYRNPPTIPTYTAFNLYTAPSFESPISHRFRTAQYLRILERLPNGWLRVCSWQGDRFFNTEAPRGHNPHAYRFDLWNNQTLDLFARMLWREMRGLPDIHARLIVRTVTNRFEAGFATTLEGVIRAPNQFVFTNAPIDPHLRSVAEYELTRWSNGEPAPVYPPFARCEHYLFFRAWRHNGRSFNRFRTHFQGYHCNHC